MRQIFSGIATIAAVVALGAALLVGWVAGHISDEDGYVEFTQTLIENDQFRASITDLVTDEVVSGANLPGSDRPVVRDTIGGVTDRVVAADGFIEVWRDTQRQSHQAVFAQAEGGSDTFVFDIGPLLAAVVDSVAREVGVTVSTPDQILIPVGADNQSEVIDLLRQAPERAFALAAVALVAAGIAVAAAPRPSRALVRLGVGAIVVAALIWAAAQLVLPIVIEQTAPDDFAAGFQLALLDHAVSSIDGWLMATAVGGLIAAVVGAGGSAFGRSGT